jgi:hypothetical protein
MSMILTEVWQNAPTEQLLFVCTPKSLSLWLNQLYACICCLVPNLHMLLRAVAPLPGLLHVCACKDAAAHHQPATLEAGVRLLLGPGVVLSLLLS